MSNQRKKHNVEKVYIHRLKTLSLTIRVSSAQQLLPPKPAKFRENSNL